MDTGAAARKAGRLLSDLFKGGSGQPRHHGHQGGGLGSSTEEDEDEEDALGSSKQAQSHTRALERFVQYVNAALAESKRPPPPVHQPALSSSSLSISASMSDGDSGNEAEEGEEEGAHIQGEERQQPSFLPRPTFRSVSIHDLLQHADASLVTVERLATHVDERWRCVVACAIGLLVE